MSEAPYAPPVGVDDVAAELGRPTPEAGSIQCRQWMAWLDDAYLAIELRAGRVGVDVGALDPRVVSMVVRKAVAAHARRPDSATQVSVSVDDGQMTRSYSTSSGEVSIADAWWDDLGLSSTGQAFSFGPDCSSSRAPGAEWWCR